MRTFRSRHTARALAALAGVSLFMTACGAGGDDDGGGGNGGGGGGESAAEVEGETIGITDTTIKIGTHHPLTGPAAPGYSEINTGVKAYFDYVNANGGVCDRQFEYIVRDDAYNPTNASQVTNQLVLQDEIFAMSGGLGTPIHSAVIDFLNEEQVPDMFVSSGSVTWNQPDKYPYSFGWQPDYTTEGEIIGKWVSENFPDAKVGLFGQGDDFGRDGFAGAKEYLSEDQIVTEVTYTPGNTDLGPPVTQLQQAGADFVLFFGTPTYTALSRLVALRLNYQPTWFVSNVGSDRTLVGTLLASYSRGAVTGGESLLEGTYTTKYIPTVEEPSNPWIQLFQRIWDEHGGDGPLTNFRVYGMSQTWPLVDAIGRICDNLNREALVKIVEEEGSEFEGPWLAPMEYSEDQHRGITGMQVVQIVGDKFEPQTEIQTSPADDPEVQDYTEDPFEPAENGLPTSLGG